MEENRIGWDPYGFPCEEVPTGYPIHLEIAKLSSFAASDRKILRVKHFCGAREVAIAAAAHGNTIIVYHNLFEHLHLRSDSSFHRIQGLAAEGRHAGPRPNGGKTRDPDCVETGDVGDARDPKALTNRAEGCVRRRGRDRANRELWRKLGRWRQLRDCGMCDVEIWARRQRVVPPAAAAAGERFAIRECAPDNAQQSAGIFSFLIRGASPQEMQ